jgi:hypothetical protein
MNRDVHNQHIFSYLCQDAESGALMPLIPMENQTFAYPSVLGGTTKGNDLCP